MKIFFSLACYLLIFLSQSAMVFATETEAINVEIKTNTSVSVIEEVIITAARSRHKITASPYSINHLHQQELHQRLTRNLPEALLEIPGVMIQKTANGQGSPFLRGFTGYRTLALIDGIRYNNSVYRDGPNEYFSLIDINSIKQLEVLNGPTSNLYGSDAIGGTLNLHTKAVDLYQVPAKELFIVGSQHYRYASAENSHLGYTSLEAGRGEQWGLHLGYSLKKFGDIVSANNVIQNKTGYAENAIDLRADLQLNDQWLLTFAYQQLQQDDVWRTHSTIYANSFSGSTIGDDLRRLKDQQRELTYFKIQGDNLQPWLTAATLTISQQQWQEDGDRIRNDNSRIRDFFNSTMQGLDIQLESPTPVGELIYGIDYYIDKIDSGRIDYHPNGSIDRVRIQGPVGDDASFAQLGLYAQLSITPSPQLLVLFGTRFNQIDADIGRFENPSTGVADNYHKRWDSIVNSARINYSINQQWSLWGGVSQSFRAPNIADLSRYGKSRSNETEIAALNLNPENFLTYEIGLKTFNGPFELSSTYYYTRIRDFITSIATGRIIDELTEVSKQNSATGYIQGIEVSASYELSNNINLFGSTTWLEGELDTQSNGASSSIEGREAMSRIMPITTTLGLRWEQQSGKSWLRLAIIRAEKADKLSSADKNDLERIPPGGTPAYTVVTLQAGYRFNDSFNLNLGLGNLFDEAYRSHGSGTNEPGFGINIGAEISF